MKKLLYLMAVCFSILIINTNSFAESNFSQELSSKMASSIILHVGSSKAYINNSEKEVDSTNPSVCPIIKDGRTLVPVRFISESLGAKVDWEDSTSTVLINYAGNDIRITIGKNTISVNGSTNNLDVPAQMINGRTFIPLRALVESLGRKIFWDERGIIVISDNDKILTEGKDDNLIDEIEIKYSGDRKLVSVPDKGNLIFNIQKDWSLNLSEPKDNSIDMEITPSNSKRFETMVGMIWNPDNGGKVSLDVLKEVANKQGTELLKDSKETQIELKDISGEQINGYYFMLTDKHENTDYKYLTCVDVAIDDIIVIAAFTNNEKDSSDELQFLNMVKNIKKFNLSSIKLNGSYKVIKYDKNTNKAYALDNTNKLIKIINLNTKKVETNIELTNKPSDVCIASDINKLYVVNEGSTNISEIDLKSGQKTKDIAWEAPIYRSQSDPYHYHIYYQNGYLYLVDASWAPGLWRVNLKDSKVEKLTDKLQNIGDMVFSKDGTNIFYWHQYGWDAGWSGSYVYRYQVDDNGFTQLDKTTKSYPEMKRDPIDTPIILNESKGWIFYKQFIFNSKNLSEVCYTFDENIYAVNETGTMAMSKNNIYDLKNFKVLKKLPLAGKDLVFFDKKDTIYIMDNATSSLYYFNVNDYDN